MTEVDSAELVHVTRYRYGRAVALGTHEVRLRPAAHARAEVRSYAMRVAPDVTPRWYQDVHGNWVARLDFPNPAAELAITIVLVVELPPVNPFDFVVAEHADQYPFTYTDDERLALVPYLRRDGDAPQEDGLQSFPAPEAKATVDVLVGLNGAVAKRIAYVQREEPGVQTPEETMRSARGSCRDSTWLLVAILRAHGFAARFASGYLVQRAEAAKQGARGPSVALHAWCEAYLPGAGWIGLDPTSGLLASECHIPLACAPTPAGAVPVLGMTEAAQSHMDVEMHARMLPAHDDAGSAS